MKRWRVNRMKGYVSGIAMAFALIYVVVLFLLCLPPLWSFLTYVIGSTSLVIWKSEYSPEIRARVLRIREVEIGEPIVFFVIIPACVRLLLFFHFHR